MIKEENMKKMLEIIDKITEAIPEEHKKHIFWSPKTNSDDGKVVGFRLYAYGGYVLKIYIETECLVYETNYYKYKDNYFGDLWDENFEKEKCNVRRKSVDINTLLGITNLWGNILEAYKRRMYGKGKIGKKYLERGRATTIARNLELENKLKDFYFIEQESRIKVSEKKPDLIGVRNKNGKKVISFIEYKCTTSGMSGVTLTEHFKDMCKFYNDVDMDAGYKTLYEQMMDFADFKYQQIEDTFKVDSIKEGEMVFLFSNINKKDGISAQKIYNDVCRLIYKCEEYLDYKKHVKFLILEDEEEVYSPKNYMTAEELLMQDIFSKCNTEQWKRTRKKK